MVGFRAAVTVLPYAKYKIKCDFLLAIWTLKTTVKNRFWKITLRWGRREKRGFRILLED